MAKNKLISFRLTEEESEKLDYLGIKLNRNNSDLIRIAINRLYKQYETKRLENS